MDEHNALALLLYMLVEGLAHHIELVVQDFEMRHAGSCFEQFVYVKVHLQYIVALGRLCTLLNRLRSIGAALFEYRLLQFGSIGKYLLDRLVIGHKVVDESTLVEIGVLAEQVQLVELHSVDAALDVHCRL